MRDYDEAIEFFCGKVGFLLEAPYGTVAVFEDLCGNWWDLVQLMPRTA